MQFILSVIFFFVVIFSHLCTADLPIHATIRDVKNSLDSGEFWRFSLTTTHKKPQLCGGGIPNTNSAMRRPELSNYTEWLFQNMGGTVRNIDVVLSDTKRSPTLSSIQFAEYMQSSDQIVKRVAPYMSYPHRNTWLSLGVFDAVSRKKVIGGWTMIYDEGFEVYITNPSLKNIVQLRNDTAKAFISSAISNQGPGLHNSSSTVSNTITPKILVLFALLKYDLKDDETSSNGEVCHLHIPNDEDAETTEGQTTCYTTNPGETSIGWFYISTGSEAMSDRSYGCFIGKKMNGTMENKKGNPSTSNSTFKMINLHSTLSNRRVSPTSRSLKRLPMAGIYFRSLNKGELGIDHLFHKLTLDPSSENLYACTLNNRKGVLHRNSHGSFLPKHYSAALNPFSTPEDKHRLSKRQTQKATLQGKCGSCYSIASTYVLRERLELIMDKFRDQSERNSGRSSSTSENSFFPNLSLQSILSCSFYNQGCNGGYPFLVGKWANEIGIPGESCMAYVETDQQQCLLDSHNLLNHNSKPSCQIENRVFASGYGYVGGCYECCSEEAMRKEIFFAGPIIVAFQAPEELMMYSDGIFDFHENHTRICDTPGNNLNGWEYTNHAVVVVGWGEEHNETTNQTKKYWIVRNSWGDHWGHDGYLKIVRGKNFLGIENQAVYIDPDFQRGYARKILTELTFTRPYLKNLMRTKSIHFHGHTNSSV